MKKAEIIELEKRLKDRSYELAKEALPKLRDNAKPATPYNYKKFYEEGETHEDRKVRDLYESVLEEEVIEKEYIQKLIEKYFYGIFKDKYDDVLLKVLCKSKKAHNTQELFENTSAIVRALINVTNTQNTLTSISERNASLKSFTSDIIQDMKQTTSQLQEGVASKKIEADFAKNMEGHLSTTVEKSKRMEHEHLKKEEELVQLLHFQKQAFDESIEKLQEKLKETEKAVYTDALTGVNNRRAFDERIQEELNRGLKGYRPCAVAMIDIDDFKKINDTHGHQIGDHALVHIANIVLNSIKHSDFLARYGGEEFVVIFPNTRYANALPAAENIRRSVEEEEFTVRGEPLKITISIGVSEIQKHNVDSVRDLVHFADKALYEAKRLGKNKVR